jgi:RND superfamily putative drug exporter
MNVNAGRSLFVALGRLAARRPWWVIGVWLVLAIMCGKWAGLAPDRLQAGSGDVPGSPSERADHLLAKDFAHPYIQSLAIAVTSKAHAMSDAPMKVLLQQTGEKLKTLPVVVDVMTPQTAPDARLIADPAKGAMVLVGLKVKDVHGAELAIPPVREAVDGIMAKAKRFDPTLEWAVTGRAAYTFDLNKFNAVDTGEAEGRVVPVTLLVLIFAFGALVAAGLPMIMGVLATILSMGVLYWLAAGMSISNLAQNTVAMIGLAVGIDYSLLVVNRFREARKKTTDVAEAIAETMTTAGSATAYSGLTVVIGMLGLLVTPLLETRSVGIGGVLVVVVSVLLAVTFLPALLVVLNRWLDSPRWLSRLFSRERRSDGWHRLANGVMRRPIPVALLCLVVLGAMSWPGLSTRFGFPVGRWLPDSMEAVRGTDMLIAMDQGGIVLPVNVVIRRPDGAPMLDANAVTPLSQFSQRIHADKRVADIFGPVDLGIGFKPADYFLLYQNPAGAFVQYPAIKQFMVSEDRSAIVMQVTMRPNVELHEAKALAEDIPRWLDMPGTEVLVGGQAAYYVDFDRALLQSFPKAVAVVLLATFLALGLAFRSVLIPLKAVVMNMLSVTAGYGAMVLVFQEGYGAKLLGLSAATQAVPTITPVLLFCIVFGLSMDYEVFLLSRIKEIYDETGDNTHATAEGLAATGGIITSAALIMVAVFGGFALARVAVVKMLGFGLAVAVLVDATIIRVLLVPALMRLAGDRNWWPGSKARP